MRQKRGSEMSLGTIVTLVLVLLVLITVALFFTGGFKSISNRFFGFVGPATNVTAPNVSAVNNAQSWFG